ncbi:MAG: pitrilysin family protein [bacterium]|nr:pitrilysin family protein [bacterium]
MKILLILLTVATSGKRITLFTLENGLRVVFIQDRTLPVFLGFIQFNTGSADEAPGLTGVSHLLEHMLFKGTKKLGTTNYKQEEKLNRKLDELYEQLENAKDDSTKETLTSKIDSIKQELKKYVISEEIWRIYLSHGGAIMNASTSNVSTQYYVFLPSNKKELWCKIESDRFKNLVLREFYSERDVVNEERRMGENNPYNKIWDALMTTVYHASPLRWPVVGWEDDIMNVKPYQVMWYYKTHYTPDNCVIVLIGDVDPENDIKLIRKYFGDWTGKKLRISRYTKEPKQNGTRRTQVISHGKPTMAIGFQGPYYPEKDYYALSIFSFIFGESDASIMKKSLEEKGIASNTFSFTTSWDGKGPSLFGIYLYPAPGIPMDSLEKRVFELVDSIKNAGIEEELLQKAKNNFKMFYVNRQRDPLRFAFTVSRGVRLFNDPEFYRKEIEIIESIQPEDVINAVRKYLRKSNASIITLGGE